MSEEVMDDHEFLSALEQLHASEDSDVAELLKMMNENRIISWEEAEQILGDSQAAENDGIYRSSLPEQTRPSEPDNDTNIDRCIQQLNDNDPNLKKINLNNMKRTPIPSIKRMIEAVAYNTVLEELSLANLGLYDTNCEMLPAVLELNTSLKKLNLETNYLSGEFFSKLFKAACVNQTLEEVKAVNQGVSFATTAEKEIIDSILANRGLIKISVNLRLPEGRHKIENATLRNGEIKRVLRREAAAQAKKEAEAAAKKPAPKPEAPAPVAAKKPVVAPAPPKPAAPPVAKPAPKPTVPAAKPEPKPEPAKPPAEKPMPAWKKAIEDRKKAAEAAAAKAEHPKPEPVKPKAEPKAAPAKPEPPAAEETKFEPKAVPAPKPKAASPPKEEKPMPAWKKAMLERKAAAEAAPVPERKTLPVTARSTSSRTSFLKETLEAKAKDADKKPARKLVRKIKKPPVEGTDGETKPPAPEKKEVNGKETNGTNGATKEESEKVDVKKEANGVEKSEEDKPKTALRRKIVKHNEKKKDEVTTDEEKKPEDEPRRAFGDDYLTTRPRRRSSAIKEVEIPTTPVKEEKPMAVYKLKRESITGLPTTLEKGSAPPAKPIPAWKRGSTEKA